MKRSGYLFSPIKGRYKNAFRVIILLILLNLLTTLFLVYTGDSALLNGHQLTGMEIPVNGSVSLNDKEFHETAMQQPGLTYSVAWYASLRVPGAARVDQGFVREAFDFLLPLSAMLARLGWVAGATVESVRDNGYMRDLSGEDREVLLGLLQRGLLMEQTFQRDPHTIAVVSDTPNSYRAIFGESQLKHVPYRIGRVMFETTSLPAGWVRLINLHLDEVWVPSLFEKEVFKRANVMRPITVIGEGFDPTEYLNIQTVDERNALRIKFFPRCSEGDTIFISVGKMEQRKGFDILGRAIKLLSTRERDEMCFYIRSGHYGTGDNPLKVIKGMRGGEGMSAAAGYKIYFLPWLSGPDLAGVYQAADVFVLATHGEGWGRPVMETMAAGTPAIVPIWSGLSEFVKAEYSLGIAVTETEPAFPGEPWFIGGKEGRGVHKWAKIDPAELVDKLVWCLHNREGVRELGRRAREAMFGSFTREKVAQRVVKRLKEIETQIERDGLEYIKFKNLRRHQRNYVVSDRDL